MLLAGVQILDSPGLRWAPLGIPRRPPRLNQNHIFRPVRWHFPRCFWRGSKSWALLASPGLPLALFVFSVQICSSPLERIALFGPDQHILPRSAYTARSSSLERIEVFVPDQHILLRSAYTTRSRPLLSSSALHTYVYI